MGDAKDGDALALVSRTQGTKAALSEVRAWMMLRMEMYLDLSNSLLRACAETMMFLGCSSRRITSSTVVLRTALAPACAAATPPSSTAEARSTQSGHVGFPGPAKLRTAHAAALVALAKAPWWHSSSQNVRQAVLLPCSWNLPWALNRERMLRA